MSKCFVTRLNEVVNNNSLLKMGELRIIVSKVISPSKNSQKLVLAATADTEIRIIGNGYFTDENISANKGTVMSVTASLGNNTFYVSNGDFEISLKKKHVITNIVLGNSLKMEISNLAYCLELKDIELTSTNSTGDISNLINDKKIRYIGCNNTALSGDISSLSGLSNLTSLYANNTALSGDISSLSGLSNLTSLYLSNKIAKGYLKDINKFTKLQIMSVDNLYGDLGEITSESILYISSNISFLTGDLAKLPAQFYMISLTGNLGTLTWTSRPSSSKIISILGYPKIDNIDTMLINQAQCAESSSSRKVIEVTGTRTSLSDSAVSTLQSKGYTISVTPA